MNESLLKEYRQNPLCIELCNDVWKRAVELDIAFQELRRAFPLDEGWLWQISSTGGVGPAKIKK